ncbi:MAG: DNA-directed RNA polymerase subunit H [Candidatus Norongarragalinales archaeon]
METLNHFLVPRVEVVQEKELAELLAKHGVSIEQLPKIKSEDPAVVALNAQAGAVLKFTRDSLVTGKQEHYYRLVVE